MQIIRVIWGICCFRASPADLPHSHVLLVSLLLTNLALAMLMQLDRWYLWGMVSVMSMLVMAGIMFGMAVFYKKQARFMQAFCAILAVSVVFTLPISVLVMFYPSVMSEPQQAPSSLMTLLFAIWLSMNLLINGHIYKVTYSVSYGTALLLACMTFYLSVDIARLVIYSMM